MTLLLHFAEFDAFGYTSQSALLSAAILTGGILTTDIRITFPVIAEISICDPSFTKSVADPSASMDLGFLSVTAIFLGLPLAGVKDIPV